MSNLYGDIYYTREANIYTRQIFQDFFVILESQTKTETEIYIYSTKIYGVRD